MKCNSKATQAERRTRSRSRQTAVVAVDDCCGLCVRGSCWCGRHGRCELTNTATSQWRCVCDAGWTGPSCQVATETSCQDQLDNDAGSFTTTRSFTLMINLRQLFTTNNNELAVVVTVFNTQISLNTMTNDALLFTSVCLSLANFP